MKRDLITGFLIAIICCVVAFGIQYTKADSGWDTSYDGGDSYSSSSWDGPSWESSDWSRSSGSNSYDENDLIFFIVIVFVLIFIIYTKYATSSNDDYINSDTSIKPVADNELEKYGINREKFLKEAYKKYVNIQKAWMNFDYDLLKELVTDELYNTYHSQLEVLKMKNQQNIMSDFDSIKSEIIDINEENNILSVTIFLNVKMYDYVINSENLVIRGSKKKKVNISYNITFVKPLKIQNIDNCPNCGGKLNNTTRERCVHCDTIIVKSSGDFVMSKKTNVGQK